jgi:protease-4
LKSFFKSFFASLLALVLFFGLVFILFFGIAGSLLADEQVKIEPNSVLLIDLSKQMSDRKSDDPFAEFMGDEVYPALSESIKLIKHAAKDSLIKGIFLVSNDNSNGFASSSELRNALAVFKKSRKFIIAYGDYISQSAFGISSIADKIYCNPKGIFEWQGMSVEYVFFKSLLDRLEVKPQIFYAGKFKSATEPFRYEKMSDANKLQTGIWLNGLYDHFINKSAFDETSDSFQMSSNISKNPSSSSGYQQQQQDEGKEETSRNPIQWYGILVPSTLKQSQKQFDIS